MFYRDNYNSQDPLQRSAMFPAIRPLYLRDEEVVRKTLLKKTRRRFASQSTGKHSLVNLIDHRFRSFINLIENAPDILADHTEHDNYQAQQE